MKITTSAGLSLKLASENCLPAGSGNWKSGALVPSGNMVEGVNAMRRMWAASGGVSSQLCGPVCVAKWRPYARFLILILLFLLIRRRAAASARDDSGQSTKLSNAPPCFSQRVGASLEHDHWSGQ